MTGNSKLHASARGARIQARTIDACLVPVHTRGFAPRFGSARGPLAARRLRVVETREQAHAAYQAVHVRGDIGIRARWGKRPVDVSAPGGWWRADREGLRVQGHEEIAVLGGRARRTDPRLKPGRAAGGRDLRGAARQIRRR